MGRTLRRHIRRIERTGDQAKGAGMGQAIAAIPQTGVDLLFPALSQAALAGGVTARRRDAADRPGGGPPLPAGDGVRHRGRERVHQDRATGDPEV